MDTSMLLGSVVLSLCGRDKGRMLVVVVIIDDSYVYVADGRLRRVESPKRKKIKHIKPVGNAVLNSEEFTNRCIRAFIAESDG